MSDREKQWEKVQIKGFTAWINSYLGPRNLAVENLQTDLTNGVRLCTFVETVRESLPDPELRKVKLDRWEKNPNIRLHYIANVNSAIKFIKETLKVKLVAIGAEDIVDGNIKYILGLLWSVFRRIRNMNLKVEDGSGRDEEMALLQWVKSMTAGYKGVNIQGWKDSWHDGLAFNALIHKFDPSLVNYDSLNPSNEEGNLNSAFQTAEKSMGIPQLLEAQDLINKNPDERSVIFYISLFFHAFVANEEKMKLRQATQSTQNELELLRHKLEAETAARLEEERRRKELEDELARLRKEIEELKNRLKLQELLHADEKAYLLEKIRALEEMLSTEGVSKAELEERQARLRRQLEEAEKAREELEELRKKLQAEGSDLLSELAKAEEERKRMRAEIEDLKKKIKAEMERRKNKARAAVELERENAALKRQALLQGKARSGLEVLKRNLEEHLEDMYHWRQLHQLDADQVAPDVFDLQKVLDELQKKSFEDQLDVLNGKLQAENINLQRIIRLKDKDAELKDVIDKQGWLEIKGVGKAKEWKKQWFVLRGAFLTYYKKEDDDRASGTIPMGEVEFLQPVVEDDRKFLVALKVASTGDKVITLAAASEKEGNDWRAVLQGAVTHVRYLESIEKAGSHRPDTRVVNLFKQPAISNVYLDGHPVYLEEINALTSTLAAQVELDTISITNANLGDNEASQLAKALPKINFRVLKLTGNKVGSKGAAAVAKAVADNKSLVEVHLDNNQVGDEGVAALSGVLGKASRLSVLNLSGNQVSDQGASSFAQAAAGSAANLKAVHLANNKLTDKGASAVAELLKAKQSSSQVLLSGNQIGDAGAQALAQALLVNDSVSVLDLSNNNVGNRGALALRDALKGGKSLHSVNLSENKGITGGADLASIMGENFGFPNLTLTRRDA